MGAIIAAILFTAAFAFLAARAGLVERSRMAMRSGAGVMGLLRDPALDDAAKERHLQQLSLQLLALFGAIVLRLVLALTGPMLVLLLLDRFGVVSLAAVERASLSWPLLVFYAVLLVSVPFLNRSGLKR